MLCIFFISLEKPYSFNVLIISITLEFLVYRWCNFLFNDHLQNLSAFHFVFIAIINSYTLTIYSKFSVVRIKFWYSFKCMYFISRINACRKISDYKIDSVLALILFFRYTWIQQLILCFDFAQQ
jgi:succinate-acetate transporter protein